MFERFSPNLIKAIGFAQEEARGLGHHAVAPEHLLLGLVRLSDDQAAAILRQRGVTLPFAIREIDQEPGRRSETGGTADLPLTDLSKEVLGTAYKELQAMQGTECGTVHLLLALLQNHTTAKVLKKLAGSTSDIESEARQITSSEPAGPDLETLRKQVSAWQNRADMASKQGNDDLVRQALEQKRKYEKLLADSTT